MKYIKRRISIENFINRESPVKIPDTNQSYNDRDKCDPREITISSQGDLFGNPNYGKIKNGNIYLKVFITQTYDVMGIFTDQEFTPLDTLEDGEIDLIKRLPGLTPESYFNEGLTITGLTDSKLEEVTSYLLSEPFIIGSNFASDQSTSFSGVIGIESDRIIYVINGDVDSNGDYVPGTGIIYTTFRDETREITYPDTDTKTIIELTTNEYVGSGKNELNSSLSAITKEERYFGIVFPEQVINDVFIDRGNITVFERHLRLAEVDNIGQLERYNNGFFNIL